MSILCVLLNSKYITKLDGQIKSFFQNILQSQLYMIFWIIFNMVLGIENCVLDYKVTKL